MFCDKRASDADGLRILAAALDNTREVAQHAFHALKCLLDQELLPAEHVKKHEAMLARLQGLRRCSVMMCPDFADHEGLQLHQGVCWFHR